MFWVNLLFLSLCLVIPCMLLTFESPQVFVVCLVSQSLLVVVTVGLMKSVWFSYILFLIFLGGMLIIFTYVSSLAASVKMDYYFSFTVGGVLVVSLTMFVLGSLSSSNEILSEYSIDLGKIDYVMKALVSQWSLSLYLYVVVYLLMALFYAGWLMKAEKGPLRKVFFKCS